MARPHGKGGRVFMDETGGSPYTPTIVADLNAWTLDMTRDRQDVTAFEDTNKVRVPGLPDFSGTFGGFWNSTNSPRLFGVVLGETPALLRLIPNILEPTYYFQGLANLDGSVNVSANGAVTISGNWDAADNWEMAP